MSGVNRMVRKLLSSPDTLNLLLVWLPVAGLGVGLALDLDRALLMSITALAAAAAMWALVRSVVLRRAERQGDLDAVVSESWTSMVGRQDPDGGDERETDAISRSTGSLLRLRSVVTRRLDDLARERENLQAILNASQSPITVTNSAGDVILANRASEVFFERPLTQLLGRPIEDLFTQAELLGQHAAALKGQVRVGQVRLPRADGIRVFQVHTAPVSLAFGVASQLKQTANGASLRAPETGVFLSLRDVTELATAVQLKTDFVANASHELRTPLSSIRAAVETLADGAWDDGPMRARLAQMIATNVDRLEDIVRDLLDLSRLESPDVEPQLSDVRISEISAALSEIFEGVCTERKLKLEFEAAPEMDRLHTDGRLLLLILKNLVDNATKFAYEGTAVRVVGEIIPIEPGRRGREGARFIVSDRGVGIPIGLQSRVFERFYQVDPARTGTAHRRGTGLGLAIVKHAVKVMGGTIGVESVWKQGTTITVELPGCVGGPAA
jgi:two-component system, OmpR family, phosphate regulon sensor histidine kinase PhoR